MTQSYDLPKISLRFERSEACAEEHEMNIEVVTIPYNTSEGPFVQILCNSILSQTGEVIAIFNQDDYCWFYNKLPYSDVIIQFDD